MTHLDDQTAKALLLAHKNLSDPEASQVWGLLKMFEKWTTTRMPLHVLESALVERVLRTATPPKPDYTFDDANLGTSSNGRLTVTASLIPRPPGLKRVDWYGFAGSVCDLLNAHCP